MDTPLKTLRLRRGEFQIHVATAVGMTQGAYSKVENGEVVTSIATARKIVKHFGDAITVLEVLDPAAYVTKPAELPKAG